MYDEWLDIGTKTYTASGNIRAPSRIDICNMVSKAWEGIPEEMISKSFICCGQAKDGTPEEITCLKEGKVAAPALEEVKNFWEFDSSQFETLNGPVLTHEIDENEDIFVVESDDD